VAHAHQGSEHPPARLAVLTVSDTRDASTDRSGRAIRQLIEQAGHQIAHTQILPDDPERVREQLAAWLVDEHCDGVIVNGGTGISRRDRTHEAVAGLLDQRLDGFGELFRMLSWEQVGSAAMLSRALGGIARGKLLFALPGSTAAVTLALERLILPELGHLLAELCKD
jgi:molybdenum cofactor biosynthesis protein B